MKKIFKILSIIALYCIALLLDGCMGNPCNCPEINFDFTDYKGFISAIPNPEINTTEDQFLEIVMSIDSFQFIVNAAKCQPSFGLMTPAYGCSCVTDGFRGDKFPIIAMDVFANRSFKNNLVAESNLNHIFEIEAFDIDRRRNYQIINDVHEFLRIRDPDENFRIRTSEIPDSIGLDTPYTFEFVATRSDGTTFSVTTEEVRWY